MTHDDGFLVILFPSEISSIQRISNSNIQQVRNEMWELVQLAWLQEKLWRYSFQER